ncbi:MAG: ChaN family lipoprotein [SAR324 cluster bacterium]|nr:ChaN family lipoprotein [SAR324 cluster bacterium]
MLAACASYPENGGVRTRGYAYLAPPEVTFDLAQGRPIDSDGLARRLARTRLLFLGEHHTEPRSHAFQLETIKLLLKRGRQVTVALEMFPPSANEALQAWRSGDAQELEFLERSGWYRNWGFPWSHYRELFLLLRRHSVPMRGINAERKTREAARKGDLSSLSSDLQEEIGPLADSPQPHDAYLLDMLRASGHGGEMSADAPAFQAYRRVQVLWERLMGRRAALLAEQAGAEGIVVVLIGSGHLAYGLGANLHAARAGVLAQLSIWDNVVTKAPGRQRYAVPLGVADLARIYLRDPAEKGYPTLLGIKLELQGSDLRVKGTQLPAHAPLAALKTGDVILALNGLPVTTPTALRLAYERLPLDSTARLKLRREGRELTLEVPVKPGQR